MSQNLSAITTIEFDAQVKQAYQTAGLLRPHVRVKTGFTGASVKFRRAGRGVATRRIPQTDVAPMNTQYAEAEAFVTDWNAPEYTDVFDQAKTNIEERAVVAANIAAAIGRREDQMIIDALDAANASASIAAGAAGLTYAKLVQVNQIFNARAVPRGARKMAIGSRGEQDLLNDPDKRFTSRDFVSEYVIQEGRLPRLFGIDFVVIDDRDEGGLPVSSNVRRNFAWDQQALGLAISMDERVKVDWIPEKTSWLANQLFSGGAVAIDTQGVIEVETQES